MAKKRKKAKSKLKKGKKAKTVASRHKKKRVVANKSAAKKSAKKAKSKLKKGKQAKTVASRRKKKRVVAKKSGAKKSAKKAKRKSRKAAPKKAVVPKPAPTPAPPPPPTEVPYSPPRARLPSGLADRGGAEIAATRRMLDKIRAVYERYGFEPLETPAIEYTDALGKFLPDQDRPNEGVFSFQDDDEQWLSLRYDLTAPLARYVAENFDALPKPYRSYREGFVFRNEKPGPGRFRQFMQFDADTVGSASMAADAEMCMMAADTMEALGIPRGSYVVKVNNRKVLDGVLESIGLGGDANAGKRLTVLRAIDKFDRLDAPGVRALLGPGRKDKSGDVTEGANLEPEAIERVIAFVTQPHYQLIAPRNVESLLDIKSEDWLADYDWTFDRLGPLVGHTVVGQAGLGELGEMARLFHAADYRDRIDIAPSVVRGLEYYTGPVYEVELTFPIEGEDGKSVRFGSVGGGGRYDGLIARFRGEPVPATGFSIGVSRLMAALQRLGKIETKSEPGPVVVTVFPDIPIAHYQQLLAKLREAEYAPGKKIRAELYLGDGKFGAQMKYADRRGSPCVVIQGGNEKTKGEIQVKDLIIGAELARLSKDREDYRKRQAEAQFAVPEDKLVDAVREVLARHGVTWD
jgi:histidyl-tRNA synthetase